MLDRPTHGQAIVYGTRLECLSKAGLAVLADLYPTDGRDAADELSLAVAIEAEGQGGAVKAGTRLCAPHGVLCRYAPDLQPNIALRASWTAAEIAVLLCSSLLPAVLASRGALVLRASAVLGPTGAILLVGPSMAGKSTAAAALASAGWPVLSDDVVVLRPGAHGPVLSRGPPWIKLWPAAARFGEALGGSLGPVRVGLTKLRYALPAQPAATGPVADDHSGVPVARVCVLRETATIAPTAESIAPAQLLEMLGTLQRPPAVAPASAAMASQFRCLCALARLARPMLLSRPDSGPVNEDCGMALKSLLEAP